MIRYPIWFVLSEFIICFSTGQWHKMPPGCVSAIWLRRRVMECCIRWPCLHNHPIWFGMSWTAEWRKSSQQELSICGKSFKTVGKAFLMMLVERMPRVWKAVIKAKGGYFYHQRISQWGQRWKGDVKGLKQYIQCLWTPMHVGSSTIYTIQKKKYKYLFRLDMAVDPYGIYGLHTQVSGNI